jgi:alanine racemase
MGIGLYGISPVEENKLQLEEIGTLSSVIRQIHVLSVGESVGYNRKFIAKKESRIATIPIGYADGIPRSLSWGKGYVLIQGKKAPIAGTICMDLLMVDISDIPEAREGDGVVLIGSQHSEHIPISKISEWAGTIPYEILSGLSPRIQRVFIKD